MKSQDDMTNLQGLIDHIDKVATGREQVLIKDILESVGYRSFGPIVLLAGLITLAPLIGDIPGVPTLVALLVLLTAGQLLFKRRYIWLPEWLTSRAMSSDKLRKGLQWCRKPARHIDRWIRPRLAPFVEGVGHYAMTLGCILVALAMPAMEVVPFSANGGGAALTAFGLAMVSRDGLLALLAMLMTAGTIFIVMYNLL